MTDRHDRARPLRRGTGATTRPIGIRHLKSETFGPYTLREQLGEGSTCAVYVAEHRESHEPLAIKVLHRKLRGDPTHAQRMLDEANMIATLHHPSIVEVFDIGTSSGGRPYVVLERLAGEPLSEHLLRGPLAQDRITRFTRQLASALDLAHQHGIVHRDLKPENMVIVADPTVLGGERIKLLDFGIAKREASTFNTQTGIVLGTPAYMAPEQARGLRRVDGRVDIYALGIVVYVMATGELPFTGANTAETLAEHAYVDPVPPHELATIAPELSAIIQRCLAKRPDDRYPRMADLDAAIAELEVRLFGATSGPPPVPPRRARPPLPGVDARPPRSDHSNAATRVERIPRRAAAAKPTAASAPPVRTDDSDATKTTVRRDVARLVARAEQAADEAEARSAPAWPTVAWRAMRAWIVRRRRVIAIAAPTAVAFVIAVIVGMAPARVEITPTAVAPPTPPVLETAPPSRLEPPGLTRRQVRKPQPVIDRDREPSQKPPRAKPAPPTSKPKPSKSASHWDPNALFFEKH